MAKNFLKAGRRASTNILKPTSSQAGKVIDIQQAVYDNPLFTRSFTGVEVDGGENGENFVDQNVTIMFEKAKLTVMNDYGKG